MNSSSSGESPFHRAALQFALNNSPGGAFKSFSATGKCQNHMGKEWKGGGNQ
jgi:hypothetical protein